MRFSHKNIQRQTWACHFQAEIWLWWVEFTKCYPIYHNSTKMLPSATAQLPPALGKTKGHPPRAHSLGQLHGGKTFLQWCNFAKGRAELTQSRGSEALKSSWIVNPQLQLLIPTQRYLSIISIILNYPDSTVYVCLQGKVPSVSEVWGPAQAKGSNQSATAENSA